MSSTGDNSDSAPVRAVADKPSDSGRELFALVYDELRRQAHRYLRSAGGAHTLQPTALVNELYLRMEKQVTSRGASRLDLLRLAATAMRNILVNHARDRRRQKRGGTRRRMPLLDDAVGLYERPVNDLIALDDALQALALFDSRAAQIVDLRFFGGLGVEETAEALNVSPRTVEADWAAAKMWLRQRLSDGPAAQDSNRKP